MWCVLLGLESGGTPSQLGTNDYDRVSWLEALDTGKILCVCVWGGCVLEQKVMHRVLRLRLELSALALLTLVDRELPLEPLNPPDSAPLC